MRISPMLIGMAIALSACLTPDTPSKTLATPESPARPGTSASDTVESVTRTRTQLTYFESRAFDSELSDAMRGEAAEIEVTVASPFTLNTVPERLDRWLYSVKKSGGRVVAEALPPKNVQVATRSVLPLLLELVVPLFEMMFDTDIHAYAKGYEAKLLYAPEDTQVQKIIFTRVKQA